MQLEEVLDGFMLSVADEDGTKVSISRKVEKVPAKKSLDVKETIWRQLDKLGGTIFYCKEINIVWSQAYFLPVSFLNDLRRDAVAKLEMERINNIRGF